MAPLPMRANRLPSSPTLNVGTLNSLRGSSGFASRTERSQYAVIADRPKAARTIRTIGARQTWPKNQWMLASSRLLSANANRTKKTAARNSQTSVRMASGR